MTIGLRVFEGHEHLEAEPLQKVGRFGTRFFLFFPSPQTALGLPQPAQFAATKNVAFAALLVGSGQTH